MPGSKLNIIMLMSQSKLETESSEVLEHGLRTLKKNIPEMLLFEVLKGPSTSLETLQKISLERASVRSLAAQRAARAPWKALD